MVFCSRGDNEGRPPDAYCTKETPMRREKHRIVNRCKNEGG